MNDIEKDSGVDNESNSFHGWRFAFIGAILNCLLSGFYGRGFAVYFLELARDLRLSHTSTSLVFGLSALEGGVQSPITGLLIDKWGPRRMMVLGALLAGIGFILLPLAKNFGSFLAIFLGVVSLGSNLGFHNGSSAIVTRWFVRNRGMAFGIISMGIAVGGSVLTPIVAYLVINHGWRLTSIVSGVVLLIVGVPLACLIRNSPEEIGQLPDGDHKNGSNNIPLIAEISFRVKEALITWEYWLLALGITLRIAAGSCVIVHIVPLMVWKGLGEGTGAIVIATGSIAAIGTRFVMGWIGDRWYKDKLVAISMLVGSASLIFLLISPGKIEFMVFFGIILSITEGAAGLTWAMIGDYFGRNSFATLRGFINSFVSRGALAMPVAAGWVFDSTSSYYWVLVFCSGLYVLAAFVFVALPKPFSKGLLSE